MLLCVCVPKLNFYANPIFTENMNFKNFTMNNNFYFILQHFFYGNKFRFFFVLRK